MRTPFAVKLHASMERLFPERRVFLKSDTDTRYIRLRPESQLIAFAGATVLVAWTFIATALLIMDTLGAGSFREQALREQRSFQNRLNDIAGQRDARAAEALAAQERFNAALTEVSVMQSKLLASETRRHELETGIDVIQATLRRTMAEREEARVALSALQSKSDGNAVGETPSLGSNDGTIDFLTDALSDAADERDQVIADAQDALGQAEDLELELALIRENNDQIFRKLEEAMTVSVEPLEKMFRAAGLQTDRILNEIRRAYSGQGGPLTPLSFSSRGSEPSKDMERANRILGQMDELNLYRIAAESAPFAMPVDRPVRMTSGFGIRRDPFGAGRRMHEGIDYAGPMGTPLLSTANGEVIFAGRKSGYGRIVEIRHDFGIETVYAHLSRIRVKVGQRVSRGDRIGDMGNSGRSTGVHLHYEIRVNGKAVNPMIYIKAAKDVF
ncbi:MAG: M23 family metallopeptidase [Pseudomonadota bacterium]